MDPSRTAYTVLSQEPTKTVPPDTAGDDVTMAPVVNDHSSVPAAASSCRTRHTPRRQGTTHNTQPQPSRPNNHHTHCSHAQRRREIPQHRAVITTSTSVAHTNTMPVHAATARTRRWCHGSAAGEPLSQCGRSTGPLQKNKNNTGTRLHTRTAYTFPSLLPANTVEPEMAGVADTGPLVWYDHTG